MQGIVRIGLDIAKRWFQVHAVDGDDREVLNRKLPRDKVLGFLAALPPCDIALEACSSSHHWGREAKVLLAEPHADTARFEQVMQFFGGALPVIPRVTEKYVSKFRLRGR
jgi:transposase